ncbi:MAG TPA: fibronectin type III domain-containing protein [Candidatus Binatia bacterium]|nr:fibronectin type III domain-containing protein [Candidatus Binatia bacterium]
MTIYVPQTQAGAPLINSESVAQTGTTTATLAAGIVPLGNDTTCTFQFVDNADFQASGYSNATSVACTPGDLGSGFTYQAPSADLSGLTTGTIYHFRVVATSSAGTSTGADQEFRAGPGAWASFSRCPVDDPAMLATNGDFSTLGLGLCLGSNSTHGSITIGNITTTTGNTNLQTGLVDINGTFTVIPGGSPAGSLVADPVQLSTPVGPVTAITESAGAPSNFDLIAGIVTGAPIITVPVKIHLANNPTLGPSCFIGSEQDPILLNPQNNDLSSALSVGGFFSFDAATGAPDVTGPDGALLITGAVQGDDTFAVPGATGCGPGGSLDAVVDAVAGLPSPSGSNHLVLDDASSSLAFAQNLQNGQAFANDWHLAFGP